MHPENDLKKRFKIILIIFFAMIFSVFSYGGIGIFLSVSANFQGLMDTDFPYPLLTQILFGFSVFDFFLILFIRKIMVRPHPTSQNSGTTDFSRYFTAVIISLAFAEAIAIFGLVCFFIQGDLKTMMTFLIISVMTMFFFRPRFEEFQNMISNS